MGAVTLRVGDLDAMTAYYRGAVALRVMDATGDTVTLGRGGTPVVVLTHAPELMRASPREAGLFHTAILFDSEEALAASIVGGGAVQGQDALGPVLPCGKFFDRGHGGEDSRRR